MSLSLTQVFNPRPGWYRGDFHAHTNFSDGALTPPHLLEVAKAEGLDFFAITDHNTIQAYPHFGETHGLLIIPGIEATYKNGHFNIFGVQGEPDWLAQVTGKYVNAPTPDDPYPTTTALMQRTASQGLLNSINHPLLKPWAWEFGSTDLHYSHCLEIWNDPSWPDNQRDNPRAIEMWTEWLNAGHRITAIGGSDFHRPVPPPNPPKPPDRLGLPSTYVYAAELSGRAILQAVRERRAYVSMGPRATFQARVNGQTFDIGADLGQWNGEIEFSATVSECATPANARIVKNGEAIAESAVTNGGAALTSADRVDAAQAAWYRFDVYDSSGLMLAITNPIFVGPGRASERHTFGDFVGGLKLE
jgi:hypothetical protein